MTLARVKNNEGYVRLSECTNRYNAKEYCVDYMIKGNGQGNKSYTYKNLESALKKYKRVTKEMCKRYMEKCN